ncbi:MAG: hypothetical protein KGL39_02775 [Patescibacteria group bacterium]|nr:hypothetical protein [Patescibacteria group bacterium]
MSLYGYKKKWRLRPDLRDKPVQVNAPKRARPRSRRMSKLMAYYHHVVKPAYLLDEPWCKVHGRGCRADQVHHTRGRAGTLLIDRRFFAGVCSGGHSYCEEQKSLARADGLLCERGLWNHAPKDAETRRLKLLVIELTK